MCRWTRRRRRHGDDNDDQETEQTWGCCNNRIVYVETHSYTTCDVYTNAAFAFLAITVFVLAIFATPGNAIATAFFWTILALLILVGCVIQPYLWLYDDPYYETVSEREFRLRHGGAGDAATKSV